MNEHVFVLGTPGAWLNVVSKRLEKQGWHILWPGQNVDVLDGRKFYNHNGENIEVHNWIRALCAREGWTPWTANRPDSWKRTFPGPGEYLAKFGKLPAVVTGIYLSAFLFEWLPYVDQAICVDATPEEDIRALSYWTRNALAESELTSVRDAYNRRYRNACTLIPRTLKLTNAQVQSGDLGSVLPFLKDELHGAKEAEVDIRRFTFDG